MKKASVSVKPVKHEKDLFLRFSKNEILSLQAMSCIRGGDGDGDGSVPIIIIPPKSK